MCLYQKMSHVDHSSAYQYAQFYLEECRRVQKLTNSQPLSIIQFDKPSAHHSTLDNEKQISEVIVLDDDPPQNSTKLPATSISVQNIQQHVSEIVSPTLNNSSTSTVNNLTESTDLQVTGVSVLKEWIDFSELNLHKYVDEELFVYSKSVKRKYNFNSCQQEMNAKKSNTLHSHPEKDVESRGDETKTNKAEGEDVNKEKFHQTKEIKSSEHKADNVENDQTPESPGGNWADVNVEEEMDVEETPVESRMAVEEKDAEENERNQSDVQNKESGAKFKCEHCPYQTDWKGNMSKHVISRHQSEEKIDWVKCEYCDYKGKTKEYLRFHLQQNHEPFLKWYNCKKCSYRSKSIPILRAHVLSRHTAPEDIKWVECDKCEFKCKFKKQLTNHYVNKHLDGSQVAWFKCEQCDYKTKTRKLLKAHVHNRHTDDELIKWQECEKCEYKCKSKGNLRSHMKYYHSETSEGKRFEKREEKSDYVSDRELCCQMCGFKSLVVKEFRGHFKYKGNTMVCAIRIQ